MKEKLEYMHANPVKRVFSYGGLQVKPAPEIGVPGGSTESFFDFEVDAEGSVVIGTRRQRHPVRQSELPSAASR